MSHMTLSTYHLHPKHERHLPFRPAAPIRFFQLRTQRKIRDGKGGANGFRKKKEIPKQSTRALPRKNDMWRVFNEIMSYGVIIVIMSRVRFAVGRGSLT